MADKPTRMQRIAAFKRREFEQKQQVNQLYAAKIAQGMTPAQAATSQGFSPSGMPYRPPTEHTITDGQTLDSIALMNNTTVKSLLDANPDLTAPKTGMVLNLPKQQPGLNGADIILQSFGMAPVHQQWPGLTPTIWGNPNPNANFWQRAARNLGYVPVVSTGIEFGARLINKLSGNRFANQWWDWSNYK